jgi:hypothetical protein
MNKEELEAVLKKGNMSLDQLQKMQAQAKVLGMTKKVIHIELDLASGKLKSQATPMDHVMHLGILEFYKVTLIGNIFNNPISKNEEEPVPTEPAALPEPVIPPAVDPAQAPAGDTPTVAEAPAAAAEIH